MYYYCYINSHCEAPDFEAEGEFPSKLEFANDLMTDYRFGEGGWTHEELIKHIASEDEIEKGSKI
jgi:hypothetical protein